MEILERGAEAVVRLEENFVVKERVKKSYRLPELDESIRKQRTSMEASLFDKARRAGITVPLVLAQEDFSLKLEFIDGKKLKDVLDGFGKEEVEKFSEKLGEIIGKLHSIGIMHGDLTTSNMIIKEEKIYLIDFGLGKFTKRIEDYATDLYLLYEALNSTHSQVLEPCWKNTIEGYKKSFEKSGEALKRLEEISKRRRYKTDS